MPLDVRYALHPAPQNPMAKPMVFQALDPLLRRIQTERGQAGIELVEGQILAQDGRALTGVSIWTQGEHGDRERFIGFAYLDGLGWRSLERLLEGLEQSRPVVAAH